MTTRSNVVVTGLGSVSALGPRRGPIEAQAPALRGITRWPTAGVRRARLVPPFQPSDVVHGLKTRRMDRLSVWALVAGHLALQDAGLNPSELVPDRVGITFGTAFGCIELTEAFMASIATNGHAKADPILFPETLGNLPASHLARVCGFKGPNVTVSRGSMSGEAALLDAVAQLECGEASLLVVLAGDVVSRGLFEWYEAAGRLAPECREQAGEHGPGEGSVVPGEGVAAVILESREHAAARNAGRYATIVGTTLERHDGVSSWRDSLERVIEACGASDPLRCVVTGPGVELPALDPCVRTIAPHEKAGVFGGGGILGLSLALDAGQRLPPGLVVVLGAGGGGQRAALVLTRGEAA